LNPPPSGAGFINSKEGAGVDEKSNSSAEVRWPVRQAVRRNVHRSGDTRPASRIPGDSHRQVAVARSELIPEAEHRRGERSNNRGGRSNNRAENSHQPMRERERRMRRLESMCQAQRFRSVHGAVSNRFCPCWHRLRARHYREIMHRRCADWKAITGTESQRSTANELS
jgi:hypothetical protein